MLTYFITKTKKMYTLWSKETKLYEPENSQPYTLDVFRYVKTLAKTLERAMEKAPEGAQFSELLLGKRGCYSCNKIYLDNHTPSRFAFGKHYNEKFDECVDDSYLCWYYNKIVMPENSVYADQIPIVGEILDSRGYILHDGKYMTFKQMQRSDNFKVIQMKLDLNVPVEINATHNLNLNGEYRDKESGFTFIFTYKYMWPTRFCPVEYGLPIDAKGKAKRIKGKTILIKRAEKIEYKDEYDRPIENVYKVHDWCFAPTMSKPS